MSALLQAVKCSDSLTTASIDPYRTLMAYFNSLRELGHAATLIRADIREYLNAMSGDKQRDYAKPTRNPPGGGW